MCHLGWLAVWRQKGRALAARLMSDNRGSYAVILGLTVVPIFMAAGAAIDLSQAVMVRSRLAGSLDAAGLAAGAVQNATPTDIQATAQRFFAANYQATELGTPGAIDVQVLDNVIKLTAAAQVNTTLLKIAGIDTIDVAVVTEITKEQRKLEVVMVLDNTGSMDSGGKMDALKVAARDLVGILYGAETSHPNLKVALVPFVTGVNIKTSGVFNMGWMDTTGESTFHGNNFEDSDGKYALDPTKGPVNHFTLFDAIPSVEWKGCVEARPEPYDTDDTEPSPSNANTRWVPYFWPDEPDSGTGFKNSWATYSGSETEKAKQQQDVAHYSVGPFSIDEVPKDTKGPNKSCPRPILPLTNQKQKVLDEIDAMAPYFDSGTNVAQGAAWGWRVLSPTAPYTEGASYDDEDTRKAMIILTDGENFIVSQDNFNKSDYNPYGYLSKQRLGTTNTNTAATKVRGKMAEICEAAKAKGIRVYTIVFSLNNDTLEEAFRTCATTSKMYFNSPSNSDLRLAFQAIAVDLGNLRISK